jgi:hypothetical protein
VGACSTTSSGPAAGTAGDDSEGGSSQSDSSNPGDATAASAEDAADVGDAGGPSAADATQHEGPGIEGGSSPGADAGASTSDGSADAGGQKVVDASASKDGAGFDAAASDAGGKGADAVAPADSAVFEAGAADAAAPKDGASPDATQDDGGGNSPFKGVAGGACSELVSLNVSWWYDWEQGPTGCTSTPFVPMVWGQSSEQTTAAITSEVAAGVAAGYKYVLGFNEPDNSTQSSITVATAISLWPAFNNPAVTIGSPATQGNATGLAWIQDFMTQVNADATGQLRVDFIATHWYGWDTGACDPAANTLESWIAGIEAIPGNRPIWLTEWGCMNESNPNAATVQAFYAGALAMFAKHPRLVRYAWYQWNTYNELLNADGGGLTPLGTAYAAAPAYH